VVNNSGRRTGFEPVGVLAEFIDYRRSELREKEQANRSSDGTVGPGTLFYRNLI
jgi:hypothetical protein